MTVEDPQTAALLAHVISQIEQNVNFLASQNYISQSDATTILNKLPDAAGLREDAPASLVGRMTAMVTGHRAAGNATSPGVRPVPPAPIPPSAVQAKALWPYNESGQDEGDLSFSAGDIVEIVEETNSDWWTGKAHGRSGLFPSTYVEKLPQPIVVPKSGKPYRPFGAAYHGLDAPPPGGQAANSVGLQEAPDTQEKKDKFGKYKNTLAHSAVGGVGFGAGSAIGGGLVRAIF